MIVANYVKGRRSGEFCESFCPVRESLHATAASWSSLYNAALSSRILVPHLRADARAERPGKATEEGREAARSTGSPNCI